MVEGDRGWVWGDGMDGAGILLVGVDDDGWGGYVAEVKMS